MQQTQMERLRDCEQNFLCGECKYSFVLKQKIRFGNAF
jgi:transposase-like protein